MTGKYERYKVIPVAIMDMAEKIGMPISRVSEIKEDVTKEILRTWHTRGSDKSQDEMVEVAWKKLFGFSYVNKSDLIKGSYLKGPPGQGKTTVFKAALKDISNALGVKLYIDPDLHAKPEKNDIVAVVSQLGGAISPSTIQGVPTTENGQTMYCPPSRIAKMVDKKFRFLLLDDLDNANDGVKSVAMPVVQDKQLNDIKLGDSCYVCVTGNLGEIDGTNTGRDSAALLNRAKVRLACDTLGDFLERGDARFQDEIGMGFIDEFLMDNPESFYPAVEKKYRGQRPTSRKWDDLINDMRNVLEEHDQQIKEGMTPKPIMPKLSTLLPGHVGNKVGQQLIVFYTNALTLARPAAMELLSKGELSDSMRESLHDSFSQGFDSKSESLSRGFLKQVQRGVFNEMKKYTNFQPVSKEEQMEASKALFQSADKIAKAAFTTGLVSGGKLNIIANTYHNLLVDLVDHSKQENDNSGMFGRTNDKGTYIPSSLLTNLLTKSAEKYGKDYPHGEALLNVGNDKKTKTALESAIIDPLTYLDNIKDMQDQLANEMTM